MSQVRIMSEALAFRPFDIATSVARVDAGVIRLRCYTCRTSPGQRVNNVTMSDAADAVGSSPRIEAARKCAGGLTLLARARNYGAVCHWLVTAETGCAE